MRQGIKIIMLAGISVMLYGCVEEGFGGEAIIAGKVWHHGQPIQGATVYIKYGATELPGTHPSDYDDQTGSSIGDAIFIFRDLEKGSYYLYAKGYDPTIFDSVSGGIAVKIKKGELLEPILPVIE
ncbi:MAG: hypothetical protein KDD99_28630 [Bacteroidetes bacterium]|nr:hypothetical protein [Bacteroidota bacterium]